MSSKQADFDHVDHRGFLKLVGVDWGATTQEVRDACQAKLKELEEKNNADSEKYRLVLKAQGYLMSDEIENLLRAANLQGWRSFQTTLDDGEALMAQRCMHMQNSLAQRQKEEQNHPSREESRRR